jgi:hypothetical protein
LVFVVAPIHWIVREWDGTAWDSDCGCVAADNSGNDCDDCADVPYGDSWVSDCGCVAVDNSGDECDDCTETPDGTAYNDDCEVCSEGTSGHTANSDIDECGICFGSGYTDSCGTLCQECDISSNTIYMTNAGELWYNITDDLYGFQFDVYGIDITGITGIDAETSGFEITYENGTLFSRVIGYTTTESSVPLGCGTLLNISFNGAVTDISNIIFGTTFGSQIPIDQYTCP